MKDKRSWPRPQITPLPLLVEGTDAAVRLLNGSGWRLWRNRERNFLPEDLDRINREDAGWENAEVPMQLKPFKREYCYAYEMEIPEQWRGKRVFLRFDGVNCRARVMIDKKTVREHYGGFVSWDCEITDYVAGGERHLLAIGVEDDPDGICTFHFGGIIRDLSLFAVPQVYLSRFHGEVSFDAEYQDAELKIYAQLQGGDGEVSFSLADPSGAEMTLGKADLKEGAEQSVSYKISDPLKWDSEHPYLYTLTASVITEGSIREKSVRRIGFRQIEKLGSEVFLNGDRLKLRGINRHDIHPLTGRALTHELVEQDVRLFKEANINFIRTSHYPPRPDFLDLCDEYGIYVEDETAVAFLGQEIGQRENDPAFTDKFMNPFAELIERDRSHPCVILWSLANESVWGKNLALENAYAHQEDPGRLTIFSYPVTQHEADERADIFSMHYAA